MEALRWFFMMLFGLFLAWAIFAPKGGVLAPFINPPAPLGSGGVYGDSINQGSGSNNEEVDNEPDLRDLGGTLDRIKNLASSPYKGKVRISSHSGATQNDPKKENIEIRVDRNVKEKIHISRWRIESDISNVGDFIGNGSYLPFSGQVNNELEIFLTGGDRAIVNTGRSPIGVSFRVNKCSGYFEQFQDFQPFLQQSCPRPIDDLPNVGVGTEADKCISFVERLPSCQIYLKPVPLDIGGTCHEYVTRKVNYNNCVSVHKDDSNFITGEWRIYLGRGEELWRQRREIIKLLDENGRVVDAITY